jgi:dipeptidyl aminopeptidase/acylaminoacyl peptidase
VKFPDLWRCGVSIVGVTDWREDYELADASFRSFDEELLGKPTPDNHLYFDRSPIHFVDRLKAPLLLWHRANDSRCPLAPVEKFAARAKALGKEVELVVVEDEGHGPQRTRNIVRQYAAAVEFLRGHLGTAPPPP